MINYKEIEATYDSEILSDPELKVFKEMENFTDACIKDQFAASYWIEVDATDIDMLASSFGLRRRGVFINKWKKSYEDNGWCVDYTSDTNESYWKFTGKK